MLLYAICYCCESGNVYSTNQYLIEIHPENGTKRKGKNFYPLFWVKNEGKNFPFDFSKFRYELISTLQWRSNKEMDSPKRWGRLLRKTVAYPTFKEKKFSAPHKLGILSECLHTQVGSCTELTLGDLHRDSALVLLRISRPVRVDAPELYESWILLLKHYAGRATEVLSHPVINIFRILIFLLCSL